MNTSAPRVLVIDDEMQIRRFLDIGLRAGGYQVLQAANAAEGLALAATQSPDLVILDLGLPDREGHEVLAELRQWSSVPVLMLSVRSAESEKVRALDNGANDYVTKPFAIGELLARIRAALRYAVRGDSGSTLLRFGEASVDLDRRVAQRGAEAIHFTPIEFRLLAALARNAGMVTTHRQLLTEVWGPTHAADTHYLRVYMKQLRDKLEPDPVQPRYLLTETGIGYRLVAAG